MLESIGVTLGFFWECIGTVEIKWKLLIIEFVVFWGAYWVPLVWETST